MNAFIFFGILALSCLVYLYLGKKASDQAADGEAYFLGGRSFGFVSLLFTIVATCVGGGTILGAAEEAYTRGWWVMLYIGGTCLGLLLLALGFGARLRQLRIKTVSELFETIYGSPSLRRVSSLLSIASLFFILMCQGIAARKFFASVGFDSQWLFIAFWVIIIAYTVMGGLRAVIQTDLVQLGYIISVFVAVTAFCLFTLPEQLYSVVTSVSETTDDIPWAGWLLGPLLFMFIEQDMGQRFFAAKSPRVVSWATATSALVLFVLCLLPITLGNLAREIGMIPTVGGSILIDVVQYTTTPALTAIFAAAVLMAVISTADSLLCAISSNLMFDFGAKEDERSVWLGRLITLAIGMSAMLASYFFNNIVGLMVLSYELASCMLFIPVILSVVIPNPNARSAALAMAFGAAGFVLFRVWEQPVPKELLSIGLSGIGFGIGQLCWALADPKTA